MVGVKSPEKRSVSTPFRISWTSAKRVAGSCVSDFFRMSRMGFGSASSSVVGLSSLASATRFAMSISRPPWKRASPVSIW